MVALISLCVAGPALGVTPAACDRTVMVHAVEHSAQDLGHGRVAWEWVWTNQGISHDFFVLDCASGEGLRAFGQQHYFREDVPFDRREEARGVIASVATSQLFSFDWLGRALDQVDVEYEAIALATEPCACAAFYAGADHGLTPFAEGE